MKALLRIGRFLLALAALTTAGLGQPVECPTNRTELVFATFSDLSSLQLNGAAANAISNPVATGNGDVLRLTDNLGQSGSAFLLCPISLQGPAGFTASFSAFFSFRISNPIGSSDPDGQGADGIVFVVQTAANNVGGAGVGIGYLGIPKSVGVEFDTWDNGTGFGDPDGNHIAIDLNGEFGAGPSKPIAKRMNDGDVWHAWVDYNGASKQLEVRLSLDQIRPVAADLTMTVDLPAVLQQPDAFVGFTSGTGAAGGNHDILNWVFRADYNPVISQPGDLSVAISDASITEGNSGTRTVQVEVRLSEPAEATITVLASTVEGTAKAGEDYLAVVDAPVTFESGETLKSISIQIVGDTVVEPNESFGVVIRKPGLIEESPGADEDGDDDDDIDYGVAADFVIGDADAAVTIVNDDGDNPAILATVLGPAVLNPQTGLFEQKVRLQNTGGGTVDGARVMLGGLPSTVKVWNASGSAEGVPYVESRLALGGGGSVDLLVEYYVVSRQPPPTPSLQGIAIGAQAPPSSAGAAPSIDQILLQQNRVLIGWESIQGRRYAVEYGLNLGSTNASDWKRAVPEIVAPANRVQWFDDGPPKTDSMPLSISNRFYRIILLPNNAPTGGRINR